jgi:hypothetical protein
MTCEGRIYVGQIGVRLEVATWTEGCPEVDWSNAETLELIVMMPNKEVVVLPASLESDGYTLVYITEYEDDLPLKGTYKLQAHVAGPGYDALGTTTSFTVYDVFK